MARECVKSENRILESKGKMDVPSYQEWQEHAFNKISSWGDNPQSYTEYIRMKYDYVTDNEWNRSVDGKDKPIRRWRPYLTHSLAHRLPNKVKKVVTDPRTKKNTKMDEIEIDEVLFAYGRYNETKALLPPNQRCFDFLLKKGVFKNGREISGKTGKPWQHWYTYLSKKALPLAVAYAIDQKMHPKERNLVRQGKHDLCHAFVKLEALKVYFKRFNDRNQLKSALLAL